jgi:hypothetical protein
MRTVLLASALTPSHRLANQYCYAPVRRLRRLSSSRIASALTRKSRWRFRVQKILTGSLEQSLDHGAVDLPANQHRRTDHPDYPGRSPPLTQQRRHVRCSAALNSTSTNMFRLSGGRSPGFTNASGCSTVATTDALCVRRSTISPIMDGVLLVCNRYGLECTVR